LALRVDAQKITNYLTTKVVDRLGDLLEDAGPGHMNKGNFISPGLTYLNRWINFKTLVSQFGWFHLPHAVARPSAAFKELLTPYLSEHQISLNLYTANEVQAQFAPLIEVHPTINLDQLKATLVQVSGETPLYFALANKFMAYFQEADPEGGTVAYRPRVDYLLSGHNQNSHILEGLRDSLRVQESVIELPQHALLSDVSEVWDLIDEKNIVIYVEALLSGNTVRQIISQVTREDCNVLAILCLYDIRKNSGEAIEDSGYTIPVIALCQNDLVILDKQEVDEAQLQWVDAITHEPENGEVFNPRLDHPISKEDLEKVIYETNALHFNHIIKDSQYHFTFFLDAHRLFQSPYCVEITKMAIRQEVAAFIEKNDFSSTVEGQLRETQVVYIRGDLKVDVLKQLYDTTTSSPISISRNRNGSGFGKIPSEIKKKHVILAVWNVGNETLSQLVLQLAQAGASSVLALAWLSRFEPQEEAVLRAIESLHVQVRQVSSGHQENLFGAEVASPKDHKEKVSVPVAFRFLSHANITTYYNYNCPICLQRNRIKEDKIYPTPFLKAHARQLLEQSKPKDQLDSLEKAYQNKDRYDTPFLAQQAVQMYDFHDVLKQALYHTKVRYELRQQLIRINKGITDGYTEQAEAKALLCLLATELQWVKSPPFVYAEFRALLSSIARQVIHHWSDENAATKHAIIVLRASDKEGMAKQLLQIVKAIFDDIDLLTQLAYDVFTMLNQDYHHYGKLLNPLNDKLKQVVVYFEKEERNQLYRQQADQYGALYNVFQSLHATTVRQLAALKKPLPIMEAWKTLKAVLADEFEHGHKPLPKTAESLFFIHEELFELSKEPIGDKDYWEEVLRKWGKARVVLESRVFPLLRTIQPILKGGFAKDYGFDADDLAVIDDLLDINESQTVVALSNYLNQFSTDPPSQNSEAWHHYKQIRKNLTKLLIEGPDDHLQKKGSYIYQFLASCPSNICQQIEHATSLDKWQEEGLEFEKKLNCKTDVFCHAGLLIDVLNEIFENVLVHEGLLSEPPLLVLINLTENLESGTILLEVLNSGTDPKERAPGTPGKGGYGLNRLKYQLIPYEAKLNHGLSKDPEWDYSVTVEFKSYPL